MKKFKRPADGLTGRRVKLKDQERRFEMNRVAQAFIEGFFIGAIVVSSIIALWSALK
jgi:hypothetical protein